MSWQIMKYVSRKEKRTKEKSEIVNIKIVFGENSFKVETVRNVNIDFAGHYFRTMFNRKLLRFVMF